MKHKSCFTNAHCCFSCPNAAADEFEERYDIPASDAGYERIESCKDCYLNSGECEDCLFQHSKDCPEVEKNGDANTITGTEQDSKPEIAFRMKNERV